MWRPSRKNRRAYPYLTLGEACILWMWARREAVRQGAAREKPARFGPLWFSKWLTRPRAASAMLAMKYMMRDNSIRGSGKLSDWVYRDVMLTGGIHFFGRMRDHP